LTFSVDIYILPIQPTPAQPGIPLPWPRRAVY
jgi:hypothetical protein